MAKKPFYAAAAFAVLAFCIISLAGCVQPRQPMDGQEPEETSDQAADETAGEMQEPAETETDIEDIEIGMQLVEDGFNSPVYLASPPDETGRLFVVDRAGEINIIGEDGTFLNLQDKIVDLRDDFDERGLLGLAFHPNFAENGRFFVYYSAPLREEAPDGWDHTSRISEFRVSEENANMADAESEKIIMQVDQPQFNHNAGQLLFGNDGYLYIALGDGGNADDVGPGHTENIGNAQDLTKLLGSILRIDTDSDDPYGIPEDNPFVDGEGRDEIFAYGFRNPFRMSFDTETERLFVGDVGQNLWEEVSIVEKGKNYGWNIMEGAHCFSTETPNMSPEDCRDTGYNGEELTSPILEYKNANAENGTGLSVIGGYIYRGDKMPELQGKYIFGDWSSSFESGAGIIFIADETEEGWEMARIKDLDEFLLGFGEGSDNELYILTNESAGPTGSSGKVYKITNQ